MYLFLQLNTLDLDPMRTHTRPGSDDSSHTTTSIWPRLRLERRQVRKDRMRLRRPAIHDIMLYSDGVDSVYDQRAQGLGSVAGEQRRALRRERAGLRADGLLARDARADRDVNDNIGGCARALQIDGLRFAFAWLQGAEGDALDEVCPRLSIVTNAICCSIFSDIRFTVV